MSLSPIFLILLFIGLIHVITVQCRRYSKTFAYLKEKRDLVCLEECQEQPDGKHTCVYDYDNRVAECVSTDKPIVPYRFFFIKHCLSNCAHFGRDHESCIVHIFEQTRRVIGRCSTRTSTRAYETAKSTNVTLPCHGPCEEQGDDGTWCLTIRGTWLQCDPSETVVIFDYSTYLSDVCTTPCFIYGNLVLTSYCYNTRGVKDACYLDPDYTEVLTNTSNAIVRAAALDHNQPRENLPNIEAIAQEYEHLYRVVKAAPMIRRNGADFPNPVENYTIRQVTNEHNKIVLLPLVIRAKITKQTIGGPPITSFPVDVEDNFLQMSPITPKADSNNFDEKSRLISDLLGGPATVYNVIPQLPTARSEWRRMEGEFFHFVKSRGYVRMTVIVTYDPTTQTPSRPTGIALFAEMFDSYNRTMASTSLYCINDSKHTTYNSFVYSSSR